MGTKVVQQANYLGIRHSQGKGDCLPFCNIPSLDDTSVPPVLQRSRAWIDLCIDPDEMSEISEMSLRSGISVQGCSGDTTLSRFGLRWNPGPRSVLTAKLCSVVGLASIRPQWASYPQQSGISGSLQGEEQVIPGAEII